MSKNPAVLLLEHHLKELKLPTFLRDYDSVGTVPPCRRFSRLHPCAVHFPA